MQHSGHPEESSTTTGTTLPSWVAVLPTPTTAPPLQEKALPVSGLQPWGRSPPDPDSGGALSHKSRPGEWARNA